MVSGTVDQLLKHSFLYSYILSQPFTVYVDAYPVFQNKLLLEAEYLKYGQHGESVRVLQHKLNKLNYYDDEIDGHFGILTEYALKKFQEDHYIAITGQANKETIKIVVKQEIDKELERLEKLSGAIYPGMQSDDVKIVQDVLYYFGYYTGEIDGIYGPLTEKAIKIAEENHDVDLSAETRESLEQLYEDIDEEMDEPQTANTNDESQAEEVQQVKTTSSSNGNLIKTAHSLIGSPYVWGGTSPNGFDCSGFVQFVYETENKVVPRTVTDLWNFATPVDSPSVGDLVFFQTYRSGPSHLGIYIGNNEFIHAGVTNGVEIGHLEQDYWKSRYLGAKRIQQ